jgi:hypothetical protein
MSDSSSLVVRDEVAPSRGDSLGNADPNDPSRGAGSTMRSFSFSATGVGEATFDVGAAVVFP